MPSPPRPHRCSSSSQASGGSQPAAPPGSAPDLPSEKGNLGYGTDSFAGKRKVAPPQRAPVSWEVRGVTSGNNTTSFPCP